MSRSNFCYDADTIIKFLLVGSDEDQALDGMGCGNLFFWGTDEML
jgi:hypothetical protein